MMSADHYSISQHAPIASIDQDVDMLSGETENTEDEVDQLDSDTDPEEGVAAGNVASSSSKARPKLGGERVSGRTIIPTAKVESIVESDGELGQLSKEAIFLLTVATEEFVKRLAKAGHKQASHVKRLQVNYRDLASLPRLQKEFEFLSDTMPEPISLAEALERRAAKEKELLEDIPPPIASSAATPVASAAPSVAQSPRGKGKSRQTNGVEESISTGAAPPPKRQRSRKTKQPESESQSVVNGAYVQEESHAASSSGVSTRRRASRTTQNGTSHQPSSAPPGRTHSSSHSNGRHSSHHHHSSASVHGESSRYDPVHSASSSRWGQHTNGPPLNAHISTGVDSPFGNGVSWPPPPPHYTGPASGYLEDHRLIFGGANGITAPNPGRTIYSHRQPPR